MAHTCRTSSVESTSEYFDMPRAAIATGAIDFVLPLNEIAPALVKLLGQAESPFKATA